MVRLQPNRADFEGSAGSMRDPHVSRGEKPYFYVDGKPRGSTDAPRGDLKYPGPVGVTAEDSGRQDCNYCGGGHLWPTCATMLQLDAWGWNATW